MSSALRIENAARIALGSDERFLLGGLVDASSIVVGSALTVALASLTPSYGEWRSVIDAFAERNSHLNGRRFQGDNDPDLQAFASDFIATLRHIGVLQTRD
ncbi:hypothetical protein [Brevibacillus choshinensis]|uniref:hypothetical protein n=1 Tax=Brevibacillus choshinensis TaxID=54911 RepID=UPI002E1F07AB|nr:hypothetical protein [Brevibacillus choshinensis]